MSGLFPTPQRRAIAMALWVLLGFIIVKLLFDLQPMPASKELREVSGVVSGFDEQTSRGRTGTSYRLYIHLRDDPSAYRLDDGLTGNEDRYFRIRNNLRRGDRLTLWIEDHAAYGQRIWQIRRGGDTLLEYLTVFDAEWQAHLMLYGLIACYAALSVAGVMYLRRRGYNL